MTTPKLSVIVPIYNVDKYLPKCLDSLLNQTMKDIEIICVNDGSPDNCSSILNEYKKKDDRIKIINQKNKGRSGARNTGISIATTKYLMFCDSDDWYDETMCEKMYDAITKNDVDFACCGIQMSYDIKNPTSEKEDKDYYRMKYEGVVSVTSDMLEKLDASSCNKIMKKEILDKYNIRYPNGLNYEDYCLFFQLLSVSNKIYCLPEYLYYYRRHENSIMVSTFKGNSKAIDHLNIMTVVYNFLIKNHLFEKWEKTFYEGFLACFYFSYTHLPKNKKYKAFDIAIPFMKTFSQEKIDKMLPEDKKNFWHSILNKTFLSYTKRLKIGKITVLKIKQQHGSYQIQLFGIQIFKKKIKKKKIIYRILYFPVFKRKIKNA